MQDDNHALIPGPEDDKSRTVLGSEQGCMTQIKKGIPIFLALLVISIVFVAVTAGLIAHFTGYFDYQQAVDQYDKKDFKESVEYSTSALEKNPKNDSAYMLRGSAYMNMDNNEKAMADFNRAIELRADLPASYDLRGVCNLRSNKPEEAIKDFDMALSLDPNYTQSYFNRGIAYSRMGDSSNAMRDLKSAESRGFKEPELYVVLSDIHVEAGEYDKGLEIISKAVEMNPNHPSIYAQRAITYGKAGEYEKAYKDFDKALELGLRTEGLYRSRGSIFWRQGKIGEAAKNIKSAIELKPDELYLGIWLYILEARQGNDAKEELVESLKKFGRHDWPEPVALMLLGEMTQEECLKKAESENSRLDNEQKCEAYFYIAQNCIIKGKKQEAEDYLRKCISTSVKNFYEYDLAGSELKHLEKIPEEK